MDGRTDGHEEANCRFSLCERAEKGRDCLLDLSVFSLFVSIPLNLGQCGKKIAFKNRFLNLIINPFVLIFRQSSGW